MTRKFTPVVLMLFLLLSSMTFSKWANEIVSIEIESVFPEPFFKGEDFGLMVSCSSPTGYGTKDIGDTQATIYWEDTVNTAWEYYVVPAGDPLPAASGTPTTAKENTITQDSKGNPLQPSTEYEYYVRAVCGTGYGAWEGNFDFKTLCGSLTTLPYTESFEANSPLKDCWVVLDENKDGAWNGNNNTTNIFYNYNSSFDAKEGAYSMLFNGTSTGVPHDDWLISPAVSVTATEVLRITYHYRPGIFHDIEFEVLLSNSGVDPDSFTTVLVPKTTYKNMEYEKKTVYVTGVSGDVHIGWHVVSTGVTSLLLDLITIEKVDCIGPDDGIEVSNIDTDSADFEWEDTHNTQWEYYVQDAGGVPPVGSGTLANSNKVTVTRTSGTGGALQPGTKYEVYVRSSCGTGKYSTWIGPVVFSTACVVQTLPFWEGFNSDSITIDCWKVIDQNKDAEYLNGIFLQCWSSSYSSLSGDRYEGDASMTFLGLDLDDSKIQHDDWLISPTFNLDATKYYRLRYHCLDQLENASYRVLLSNNGVDIKDFTVVLDSKEKGSAVWEEEILIIGGVGGDVNLAWHVNAVHEKQQVQLVIDNVFFEEIPGCPEPFRLNSADEETNQVTIGWEGYGNEWEYVVQKKGGVTPSTTATGTATSDKEVVIDKDKKGDTLAPNTEYEFYVRTDCGNGDYSVWSGPYAFRTTCMIYDTPFWEGFNLDSESANCWTVVDRDRGVVPISSNNIWTVFSKVTYEGTSAMEFEGRGQFPHNDWLISPKIRFESGKTYRLKYHYRTTSTTSTTSYDYEFEVLLSNSGVDTSKFTTSVVPKKKYDPSTVWQEEYVFISGVSGDVNIAWHVTSSTQYTDVYIDNVFIEEVAGCPEPLPVTFDVKDEKSDSVTLLWDDDFGATAWEYYIQEEGGVVPVGSGIATTNKENIATLDGAGNALKPNTDYEFYVRTNCGNGEYSIWQGPYQFTTACGVYTTPFWDGFNTADKIYRCWTVIDGNGDSTSPTGSNIWRLYDTASGIYEGDQSMYFYGLSGKTHDDWLISPTIEMDPALYVLKYRYKTSATASYNSSFEILLSSQGIDTTKFTTTVLSTDIYKEGNWKEGVVFFNGVSGDVNLAWHVNSTGTTYVYLDDIDLKKVETCPEPYYVTVTNQTSTSIELEWEQYGGVTSWEVIVVNYGEDETATPVQTVTVTSAPQTTITGLDGGRAYTIYVRAKCTDGTSNSDWSTLVTGVTKVGANGNCDGAIVIPVNDSLECMASVGVTLFGATASSSSVPDCAPNLQNDIWFVFTATAESLLFRVGGLEDSSLRMFGALYDDPCNSISATPIECFEFSGVKGRELFTDLIPGQRYYIRLGVSEDTTEDKWETGFNLCLTSSPYLEVSESGIQYTTEELVKEVLINSNCDLVSNVHYQNGDGSLATQTVNTLGYFNRGKSDFPFEEGVVLSTGPVEYVPGPYGGTTGSNPYRWEGDQDINDAIADAGGGPLGNKRVTQLEFDFIPVADSIHFEYLLASNSYYQGCVYACENAALFAAWLIDTTTGIGQNLAKIPETNLPVSLNTIWDSQKIVGSSCGSVNPEFFWNSYDASRGNADPLEAPFNFAGSTIAMFSETVPVTPGRQYHIKLAVIDFCTNNTHTSAAFFNANSFDLGNLDLGPDLLVETNNALCEEESVVIQSGMAFSDELETEVEWYKDGVLLTGERQPDLEVSESGEYEVRVHFPELDCAVSGSIQVEIYPPISEVVHQPRMITVCRNALEDIIVDLEQVEAEMFSQSGKDSYTTAYFETEEEAALNENPLQNTIDYNLGKTPESHTLYIRVDNTETGCHEVFELRIQPQKGEIPEKPESVTVCAEYVFPELESNQYYYSESGAGGVEYKAEEVLDIPDEHTIYVLQLNNEEGCYEETSFKVNVTAPVIADVFEDVEIQCELYELRPLSEYNRYFTGSNGGGTELYAGMEIPLAQTIYVYAESEDGLCVDESSFTVTYNDCPIPRGISPNGDGFNDTFDLSRHGVESIKIYNRWGTEVYSHGIGYTDQWYGQSKNGKELPDGTYYYVIIAHGKTRTGWVQINR